MPSHEFRNELETLALDTSLTLAEFELQGLTIGAILRFGVDDTDGVKRLILDSLDEHSVNDASLGSFVELNVKMLNSESMDFQLLISEDESAEIRLQELSYWITSFFCTSPPTEIKQDNEEISEIIEDFQNIADVDTDLDKSSVAASEQESIVEQCIEHVRVGVMLLNEMRV